MDCSRDEFMIEINLHRVAERVVHRARLQGYVMPRQVREELDRADLDKGLWRDVLALARASLTYRSGRYYYLNRDSDRELTEQEQQSAFRAAILDLIGKEKVATGRVEERRDQERVGFVQPVRVTTDDHLDVTMLSRDLSNTGIRLLGTQRLLGRKVHVFISRPGSPTFDFVVRVLWTCPVGDELVENGGVFLSVAQSDA
jgi:hypothetical protein